MTVLFIVVVSLVEKHRPRVLGLQQSWLLGSRAQVQMLWACSSAACGIFRDQGSNPWLLHRQADSYPLSPREALSPCFVVIIFFFFNEFGEEQWSGLEWSGSFWEHTDKWKWSPASLWGCRNVLLGWGGGFLGKFKNTPHCPTNVCF